MDFVLFSSLGLIKLSILFFYKKIFAISRRFRVVAWIAIVLIIVWTVSFSFAYMCMSTPLMYLDVWLTLYPSCLHPHRGKLGPQSRSDRVGEMRGQGQALLGCYLDRHPHRRQVPRPFFR